GVNPQLMVIVSAGRALDCRPGLARIGRSVYRGIGYVDGVSVFWIDDNLAEVPPAAPDPLVLRDQAPIGARVVRAIQAACLCVDDRVDPIVARRCDRQSYSTKSFFRGSRGYGLPGGAPLRGFEDSAPRALRG